MVRPVLPLSGGGGLLALGLRVRPTPLVCPSAIQGIDDKSIRLVVSPGIVITWHTIQPSSIRHYKYLSHPTGVCVFVCLCVYVCVRVCLCACMYMCVRVYVYVCMCACICA